MYRVRPFPDYESTLEILHVCDPSGSDCYEIIEPHTEDDFIDAFVFYNKCDDCCRVIGCGTCGPCETHEWAHRASVEGWLGV